MTIASILRKVLMGVSGLVWFAFVIGHLTGNFLIFRGPAGFNRYSQTLHDTGPLLIAAEALLVGFLLLHIYAAIRVTLRNRASRPIRYEVYTGNGKATLASRSMVVGGALLAVFIAIHLKTFKFGDASGENGLWGLVMRTYENPLMVSWYVLAMVALGLHLSHGAGSAFQTLGVIHPPLRRRLRQGGYVVGWLIAAGFASMPLWAYFAGRG